MVDFYLRCREIDNSDVLRACTVLKRLPRGEDDDALIVRVTPPFPASTYHTREEVGAVMLAARYHGQPLREMVGWPTGVNVVLPRSGGLESIERFDASALVIHDWADIFATTDEADLPQAVRLGYIRPLAD